jgi:hypothetical protein
MARRRKITSPHNELPLPAKVIRVDPVNLGSIHARTVCVCDDSVSYVIKDDTHHPSMPHAEWFCTHLASLVGIPSIPCRVLEMPADAAGVRMQVFGSVWQSGELPKMPSPWFDQVQHGVVPIASIAAVCSWIYAFDHFIYNFDRHPFNFFARKSHAGFSLFSVDYSNSWTCCGFPLPPLPFDLTDGRHRTVLWQREFTSKWGPWLDSSEVLSLISKIKAVTKDQVKYIIQTQGRDWLSGPDVKAILRWWRSKAFESRLNEISAGIINGTVVYV